MVIWDSKGLRYVLVFVLFTSCRNWFDNANDDRFLSVLRNLQVTN